MERKESQDSLLPENGAETTRQGKYRLTLEPAVFLTCFALLLTEAVFTNLILERTCEVTLGLDQTTCDLLESRGNGSSQVESLVQPIASKIILAKTIIAALIPALLSFFLGPWSDIYGRKLLLLSPICGASMAYMLLAVLSNISGMAPGFYLLAMIPICLSGGFISLLTAVFCYITDITDEKQRAIRIAILDGSFFLGVVLGSTTSSYIFEAAGSYGYLAIFSIAAFFNLLGALHIYYYVPETVVAPEGSSGLKEIFKLELVRDMFYACFKKRERFDRGIILILIFILACSMFIVQGEGTVAYLFVRHRFNWTLRQFTLWSGFRLVVSLVGTAVVCIFLKYNKLIPEVMLAIFALSTKTTECFLLAFTPASSPSLLYIYAPISMFNGISSPICRSILSQVATKSEIGKIFSFTSSMEAISPLIASSVYTLTYNSSMNILPGAYYLLSGFTFLIMGLLLVPVQLFYKPPVRYQLVVNVHDE